jgi:hypothetical protein
VASSRWDYHTGKTYLLDEFERNTRKEFLAYMEEYNTTSIFGKNSNSCQI